PPAACPGPGWSARGTRSLLRAQLLLPRVPQRPPRGLDDVIGDAHGAPGFAAVAGRDQHARLGRGAFGLVEDSDLVVEQAHRLEVGIKLLERLAKRVVQRVHGTVAGRSRMLEDALHAYTHRCLGHRFTVAALFLHDHAVGVELEVRLVAAQRALHEQLERRPRTLELEALILQLLQAL